MADNQNNLRTQQSEADEHETVIVGHGTYQARLIHQINKGAFGEVYLGSDIATGRKIAVKLESMAAPYPVLLAEGNIHWQLENGPGIPQLFWFGEQQPHYCVMLMELMGPNLQQLLNHYGPRFSIKTVLLLADQILNSVEFVHSKCFVHRDISTNNILIGLGEKSSKIYLTDFGMAKKMSPSFCHQGVRFNRPLIGTPRFASIAAHKGLELSRKDDLESLGYVLLYLLRSSLPWSGLEGNSKQEKLAHILRLKSSLSISSLCEGLPVEFMCFMQHVRCLKNFDVPAYEQLRQMFRSLADKQGIEYNGQFDWHQKSIDDSHDEYENDDLRSRKGSTSTNFTQE